MRGHASERGHVLILGCLLLFVLAIGVLTTAQLAHRVHQRVALQNEVDAAAYSQAALEARAFNFYAFANRSQISHYVSAMNWQATHSFLYFIEAWLTDFLGVFLTLQPLLQCTPPQNLLWQAVCGAALALPGVGPLLSFLSGVGQVFRALVKAVQFQLTPVPGDPGQGVDRVLGQLVTAHRGLNQLLAAASTSMGEAVISELGGSSGLGQISRCLFDRAHQREANGSPLAPASAMEALDPWAAGENSAVAKAKRVMGQLSNASRYACAGDPDCVPSFLTGRKEPVLALPDFLGRVSFLFQDSGSKWGQTRFLSRGQAQLAPDGRRLKANLLRDTSTGLPGIHIGETAAGDTLASDDGYEMGMTFLPQHLLGKENPLNCPEGRDAQRCWGDPGRKQQKRDFRDTHETSIWATHESETARPGGLHYRVVRPGNALAGPPLHPRLNQERDYGLDLVREELLPGLLYLDVYVANVEPVLDGNHDWPGLVPFSHFEAGHFPSRCRPEEGTQPGRSAEGHRAASRAEAFNQPSVWHGAQRVPLPLVGLAIPLAPSTLASSGLPFAEGEMNAVARAQVYYHRPGNWSEPPNFFNPYWRPRLASIAQALPSLPWQESLLRRLPKEIRKTPEQFVTH